MANYNQRVAIEVGLVFKAANEGKDETVRATTALTDLISQACREARSDALRDMEMWANGEMAKQYVEAQQTEGEK